MCTGLRAEKEDRWIGNDLCEQMRKPLSFSACLAINHVDPLGLDVIYLLDRNALPRLGSPGHAAVLVGSDATSWTYGSFSTGDTKLFRGDNLELNKFKTLDEAK